MPESLSSVSNVNLQSGIAFVDPVNGSDVSSARTPSYPAATWARALASLNGKGGTVVVCSDTPIIDGATTTSTIHYAVPEQLRPLTITGKYNGRCYNSKLLLGKEDNSAKIILSFLSEAALIAHLAPVHLPRYGRGSPFQLPLVWRPQLLEAKIKLQFGQDCTTLLLLKRISLY